MKRYFVSADKRLMLIVVLRQKLVICYFAHDFILNFALLVVIRDKSLMALFVLLGWEPDFHSSMKYSSKDDVFFLFHFVHMNVVMQMCYDFIV